VLRDPESGRYFTWELTRRQGRTRLALRITEQDPLPRPFAAPTEGFLANDLRPGSASALCYDVLSGTIERKRIAHALPLAEHAVAEAVLAAPVLIQRESRGWAIVARETGSKFTRDDLEFLVLIVAQTAAGFENARLQAKAEEVAVLEERTRIARDLHDGFIQSLAGIDLRIEACKVLLQRDPQRVPRELEELHQAVDSGYREVRRYLKVLREARRPTDDLWAALDRLVAEFPARERLRLHVERPSTAPPLAPEAGYEVVQIVREALRNAIRHGRATQAIVKIGCRPSHLYLVVRDNGSGFQHANGHVDPDGYLAESAAPWSIRERAGALGASLRVWTQPGKGTEISLTIPAPGRNGRHGAERRMQA
jgi:signal transduction histidine kinase